MFHECLVELASQMYMICNWCSQSHCVSSTTNRFTCHIFAILDTPAGFTCIISHVSTIFLTGFMFPLEKKTGQCSYVINSIFICCQLVLFQCSALIRSHLTSGNRNVAMDHHRSEWDNSLLWPCSIAMLARVYMAELGFPNHL